MFSISELKLRGRAAMKKNYWNCVLIALILSICIASGNSNGSSEQHDGRQQISYYTEQQASGVLSYYVSAPVTGLVRAVSSATHGILAMAFALVVLCLSIAIKMLFFNALEIGCRRFFILNINDQPDYHCLPFAFNKAYYGNIVATQFLRHLYIFLWTLCLIVPGIIKSYEFRLVPYLLAEYPDLDKRYALDYSRKMMHGHKLNAFILDLSFLGWHLLSILTCGVLTLFWTNPYVYATDAELYDFLKNSAPVQ